jgi:hypothetical protein
MITKITAAGIDHSKASELAVQFHCEMTKNPFGDFTFKATVNPQDLHAWANEFFDALESIGWVVTYHY